MVAAGPAPGARVGADLRPPRVPAHRLLRRAAAADDRGDHRHRRAGPRSSAPRTPTGSARLLYRGPGQPQMRSARYLLSSVFSCGLCGSKLVGRAIGGKPALPVRQRPRPARLRPRVRHGRPRRAPRPATRSSPPSATPRISCLPCCAGTSQAPPAHDGSDPGAELRRIDERRDQLAADWARGDITRRDWPPPAASWTPKPTGSPAASPALPRPAPSPTSLPCTVTCGSAGNTPP